jgi:RNA polymerase sigma-70 factor (ECF subfamily)
MAAGAMANNGDTMLFLVLAFPDLAEEDRLLAHARQGNRQAIGAIYEQYFDAVYQFVRWRVHDPGQAEDLTSEVFIKLLAALQGPNAPQHSLRGWLFRVARNVLYDHYRQPDLSDELNDFMPAPDDVESLFIHQSDAERVQQALHTLADDQQEVLILRFGQMMSLEATAESMGRSVSAVKSLQFRAVQTLRRALGEETTMEAGYGVS